MKTTSNAGALLKSASETILPLVSGSLKSGALVPSGNIVEFTATMGGNLPQHVILVDVKGSVGQSTERPTPHALRSYVPDASRSFLKSAWHGLCDIIKLSAGSPLLHGCVGLAALAGWSAALVIVRGDRVCQPGRLFSLCRATALAAFTFHVLRFTFHVSYFTPILRP